MSVAHGDASTDRDDPGAGVGTTNGDAANTPAAVTTAAAKQVTFIATLPW
jgi:hypothetical protein